MGEHIIRYPVIPRYFKTQVEGKYRFIEYDQYLEEDSNVTLNAFLKSIVGEMV